tara:strand:- start:2508 stop:3287 length:780 start_codon:yes stop_codon:yes gene_type:complete
MLMDGKYSFEVRAIDNAGNIGPANATWIRVDRNAPIVSIEQLNASRSPISKLVVELSIDDGEGSGPSIIEWSNDNLTWNTYREDGLILWDDWNNTDLFIRVTDGANLATISVLNIDIPLNQSAGIEESENEENLSSSESGGISTLLAFIVALAIIVLSVFTVMLAIRLRTRTELDEESEEEAEAEGATESEPVEVATVQTETYHVPDFTHLVGGGVYDQSTGHTAYIDPEGRWWWQQEDGSFFHDPSLNANDATQDGLP